MLGEPERAVCALELEIRRLLADLRGLRHVPVLLISVKSAARPAYRRPSGIRSSTAAILQAMASSERASQPPGGGSIEEQVVDATRRTRLANERTYLAWWRTGLAAFAVSLAAGRLVPAIAGGPQLLYSFVGVLFG